MYYLRGGGKKGLKIRSKRGVMAGPFWKYLFGIGMKASGQISIRAPQTSGGAAIFYRGFSRGAVVRPQLSDHFPQLRSTAPNLPTVVPIFWMAPPNSPKAPPICRGTAPNFLASPPNFRRVPPNFPTTSPNFFTATPVFNSLFTSQLRMICRFLTPLNHANRVFRFRRSGNALRQSELNLVRPIVSA
jgi:hypothetical protein